MKKYIITGPNKLNGQIPVRGAKNAALKIFPASILLTGTMTVNNVPLIEDIQREKELLEDLGAEVTQEGRTYKINTEKINKITLNPEISSKIRASILFVGAMLARFNEVTFSLPGGDNIASGAKRPINFFLTAFQKMGAELNQKGNQFSLKTKGLNGIEFFFPKVSHTATESLIITACLAKGETVLKNCAMEPEIVALADYLNSCGAKISGQGTPTIKIEGVNELKAGTYQIIPDRLETGTFAMLAAITNSKLTITNCNPLHIEALLNNFERIGVEFKATKNTLEIINADNLVSKDLTTHEYPGFATDLMPPYAVLMTQTNGPSLIHETIFDRRLMFTDTLMSMGANIIMCDPHRVVINGPTKLHGQKVISPDVRAGIALVIAGLVAEGKTAIDNVYQIERGYEDIVGRLRAIGAKIEELN